MDNDNIQYYMSEDDDTKDDDNNSLTLSLLLNDLEQINECENKKYFSSFHISNENSGAIAEISNYEINFTNKQLHLILEYYGLSKGTRLLKKQDLISYIMMFETDPENSEITAKRKRLWVYMDELKQDKVLKRFILAV